MLTVGATTTRCDLHIPENINGFSVLEINESSFENTTGIISLPNKSQKIGMMAFANTTEATGITFTGKILQEICELAFYRCGANIDTPFTLVIPPNSRMNKGAFQGAKIKDLNIMKNKN